MSPAIRINILTRKPAILGKFSKKERKERLSPTRFKTRANVPIKNKINPRSVINPLFIMEKFIKKSKTYKLLSTKLIKNY